MKIGIIDFGAGNLGSITHALRELDCSPIILDKPENLDSISSFVLPGVGNFSDASAKLISSGWYDELTDQVILSGKPLLGICLGMQLLATRGSEGAKNSDSSYARGLDFIPGSVEHLKESECKNRIPHVGWNSIHPKQSVKGLFSYIPSGTDFYFVHSYSFKADNEKDILATTDYSCKITAAVGRARVWGTQFHPEKSSKAGFQLLKNFIEMSQC